MLKSLLTALTLLVLQSSAATPVLSGAGSIVPIDNTAPANQSTGLHASTNWAGYTAQGGTYGGVGASWNVPSVAAQSAIATDATWVGIGGITSGDLIQAGTQALVQDGQVTYSAWYETLPSYQQKIPLTIHAGDSITASLTETTPGVWQLSFTDLTTGKNCSQSIPYNSSKSSAEWIEERPIADIGRGFSLIPLDQFGSVSFTGAYAIVNGARVTPAAAGATALSMVNGGANQTLATASSLNSSGAFSVSRATGTTQTTQSLATAAPVQQTVTQTIPSGSGRSFRRNHGGYSTAGNGQQYIIRITLGNGISRVIEL